MPTPPMVLSNTATLKRIQALAESVGSGLAGSAVIRCGFTGELPGYGVAKRS
jgi:hypothetical protein